MIRKTLLGAAILAGAMFAAAGAIAAPTDCTREIVNLSPAVAAINHCDHELKWWGAYYAPGNANGGGPGWVAPAVVDEPSEEPCKYEWGQFTWKRSL